ncbi:MAG TPA: ribonuclease J [Patescibacteria group bacterium]|nr:ribonuclease J [Patescibacteria group bacterium]
MASLGFNMDPEAIYCVPLGGCGVFGANMTLYGHKEQWIMIDCGMGFADETMPGVDILLPDPAFATSLGSKLLGIFFTHGHEDHIGAVDHLWPRLKAPLYATKFTLERLRQSLSEMAWGHQVAVHELPQQAELEIGPFHLRFIRMAHSIPEARAVVVSVKSVGNVLHTGDWKIDADPIIGDLTDEAALRKLGEEGVLAVVGDSTNAMVPGHSGSEREVQKNLADLFGEFDNQIAVTCFATNVGRIKSIYEAARANDRSVCLVGRSLWSVDDAARKSGYLKDVPLFLDDEAAHMHGGENVVYICTGSQGEPRAALARVSNNDHPAVRLGEGDVMIFSSRTIPGNDRAVDRIKNRFLINGVNVITERDAPIHVSGHPYREELKKLYSWVKPKAVIPVHGEHMQQEKHAQLAQECGVNETFIPVNGDVIEITKEGLRPVGEVQNGILAIEGNRIVAVDNEAILTRKRIMFNGSAIVTVVMNDRGALMAPPRITALGLLDETSDQDTPHLAAAEAEVSKALQNMPKNIRNDDDAVTELVRVTARRFFSERFDRKPQTRVHLIRV